MPPVARAVLATAWLTAMALPTAAQSPSSDQSSALASQVPAMEAACRTNAPDDDTRKACLETIYKFIVPGAVIGLGHTYEDPNLRVTIRDARWDASGQPEGKRWVSLLVAYEATEGADYNIRDDWDAEDEDGDGADNQEVAVQPALGAGSLAAGQTVEGWITFQVDADLTRLDVTYSDGLFGQDHLWVLMPGVSASEPTASGGSPVQSSPPFGPSPIATLTVTPEAVPIQTPGPTARPRPTPVPTLTPTPKPPSVPNQVDALMETAFGDSLRYAHTTRRKGGGWTVRVDFDASDNLRMDWIRGGIEFDMQDAYEALYTSGLDIRKATMSAHFPTVDKYGNDHDTVVYRTTLVRGDARKVNWDEAAGLDWGMIWTVDLMHPELRDS